LDLDLEDVFVNEGCVLDVGRFVEMTSNTFYDESLDLICWNPADSSCLFRLALQKRGRDVVPVLDADPLGLGFVDGDLAVPGVAPSKKASSGLLPCLLDQV
jgi:hypothetical protein